MIEYAPAILFDLLFLILGIATVALLLALLLRWSARRSIAVVGFGAALLAIGAMALAQPATRIVYGPDPAAISPAVIGQRGLYAVETDAGGARYQWTQERATLLLNTLPRGPVTLTFDIRSAAVAGGPDAPVRVVMNGEEVGQLHPDPRNPIFQSLSLRVVPRQWGGAQSELALTATPFKPKGDTRTLGTMIAGVTVDTSAAWSSVARRMWLVAVLPVCAVAAAALALLSRRRRLALAGHAALVACAAGAGCTLMLMLLVARAGAIAPMVPQIWLVATLYLALCFVAAAFLLPLGAPDAPSIAGHLLARPLPRALAGRGAALRWRAHAALVPGERRAVVDDLIVVFLLALAVRLVWAVIMPPWQATDEPEHFSYTNHLVEQHGIPHPPGVAGYAPFSRELRQSLDDTAFYPLAQNNRFYGKPSSPVPASSDFQYARGYAAAGEDRYDSGQARAEVYPPLYYLAMAVPDLLIHDAPIVSRLLAMRAATAILGALSCVFAYLFAYELRRARRWGWALGVCVALMPTYAHLTASVNNDAALNLGALALLWLIARLVRRAALSCAMAVALGVVSGLLMLTKPTALPVMVVAGAVALAVAVGLGVRPPRLSLRRLPAVGLFPAAAIIVYSPWMLFRYRYYGNVGVGVIARPLRMVTAALGGAPQAAILSPAPLHTVSSLPLFAPRFSFGAYLRYLRDGAAQVYAYGLFDEFWGRFGWGGAYLSGVVLAAIALCCAIGMAGAVIQFVRQRECRRVHALLVCLIVLQMIFLLVGVDYYLTFSRTGVTVGLQGRYLFPILAPLFYLLLSGWDYLVRWRALALRAAPALLLALQLAGLAAVLTRYFGVAPG